MSTLRSPLRSASDLYVYVCVFVCGSVEVCKSGGTDVCIWWNIHMYMVEHIYVYECMCV